MQIGEVETLAKRCLKVRDDGTASWSARPLGVREMARLLRMMAGAIVPDESPRAANIPWTPEDDRQLVDMYQDGVRVEEIAARLCRTVTAVRSRIVSMRSRGARIARCRTRE